MTHEEAQAVADLTAEHFGILPVPIQVKNVQAGRARYRTRKITIPRWALADYGEAYATAYVVHEIAHFVVWARGLRSSDGTHGPFFKRYEDEGLALWDLSIERARSYVKEIYANGQCLWPKKGAK